MATIALLDVERTVMTEPSFALTKKSADIRPPQGGRNKVYQWPGTKTWTLMPLNLCPNFAATNDWEALKFRLADCDYDPDWWTEVPENHFGSAGDEAVPGDYFFSIVVKNTNVPTTPPGSYKLLDLLVDVAIAAVLAAIDLQTKNLVCAIASTEELPKNQGYTLRWFQEGRSSHVRAAILQFDFGDFALSINSDGTAELWQRSDDPETYGLVYVFSWTNTESVHNHYHTLSIYPHGRRTIEFIAKSASNIDHLLNIADTAIGSPAPKGKAGFGLYELPGDLVTDEDGNYNITEAGKWKLSVSREYRPYIQVARLGFVNGTEGDAALYDEEVHLTGLFGEDYIPTLPIQYRADFDNNGCVGGVPLLFPDTVGANPVTFGFGMEGKGDIAGPGLGSSASPEFFAYSLTKPANFDTVPRTTLPCYVRSVRLDFGDSPESERMTLTIDNSCPGDPVDAYRARGEIPLQLGDTVTGVTYFEGTSFETTSAEAPAVVPRTLRLEAMGMADALLRKYWFGYHNFGVSNDPEAAPGTAWTWPDAVRACFQEAGFNPETQVIVEEESAYSFPLWPDAGVTHEQGVQQGSKWAPQGGTPIYEFLSYLITDVLGWHFYWDRNSHLWRIYKRPDPLNTSDVDAGKFNPKANFYKAANWCGPKDLGDGLPSYAHRDLSVTTERCRYSTVVTFAPLYESKLKTRDELKAMLAAIQADPNVNDSAIRTELKKVPCTITNPNAVFGPSDHPDYLGQIRAIVVLIQACANRTMQQWLTRRLFDDNCHARTWATWTSDWGDVGSAFLRKWDPVNLDTVADGSNAVWIIDRVEPEWTNDRVIQARYRASLFREDAPPPR